MSHSRWQRGFFKTPFLGRLPTNQAVCACTCFAGVDNEYLLLTLKALRRAFVEQGAGGAQPNISKIKIVNTPCPLPSLREQTRIVAKVDQLMALCDELEMKQTMKRDVGDRLTKAALAALTSAKTPEEFKVAWERVSESFALLGASPARLAELRTTILGCALSGRTVGAGLQEGAPPGWMRTSLGDLADFVSSGSRNWKNHYSTTGAIFVRSQDISGDCLDRKNPAFVDPPPNAEGTRTRLCVGDLLITITGANVGRAALLMGDIGEAYVSQHVALVRLRDVSLGEWIHSWLVCPSKGRGQLLGSSYGDKPGLNLQNVKDVIVDVPPREVRPTILLHARQLLAMCDELEARLQAREETAERLSAALVTTVTASLQVTTS